ncbi:MAG: GNAT family N-acetyltransferase [Acidimicrobiales bacterium]
MAPHLTLIPPLNVGEPDLPGALGVLRAAAFEDPIPVELGPAGSFSGRSTVLYLAVSDPAGLVERLQRRLDQAPLAAPPTRPSRPFSAHVTLSSRIDRAEIRAAVELFAHFKVQTQLSALTLYEQHHEKALHPWFPLADVVFGASTSPDRGGRRLGFVVSRIPGPDVPVEWRDAARVDGGTPVFVIGREGAEVVATARGAIVGTQLVIDSWCVVNERRGEGVGRALVRAIERAAVGLGAERVLLAASTDVETAFFVHLGLAAESGFLSPGARWFSPRRSSVGGVSVGGDLLSEAGEAAPNSQR